MHRIPSVNLLKAKVKTAFTATLNLKCNRIQMGTEFGDSTANTVLFPSPWKLCEY